MRRVFIAAVACLCFVGPANSQPSYSCSGNLNRVERTICQDRLLSRLDVEMVRHYRAAYRQSSGARRTALREAQSIWLRWRNTCSGSVDCIRRRYEQRIEDLAPSGGGAQGGSSGAAVERRIRDGRLEIVKPDGTIVWQDASGGPSGTDNPDGTSSVVMRMDAPAPSFPVLPPAYADWGSQIERDLLWVVRSLLPQEDHGEYDQIVSGKQYSDRVNDHIRTIGFLTGG